MTSLIAILSSGKGTLTNVLEMIKLNNWEKVFLVCNEQNYNILNFSKEQPNIIKLKIDENNPQNSVDNLAKEFKKQIKDFEIALNFVSGTGLEHMAIISAVMKAGLGIRLVYSQNKELREFKIIEGMPECQGFEDDF